MRNIIKIFLSFLLIYEPLAYFILADDWGACRDLLTYSVCNADSRFFWFMVLPIIFMAIYLMWEKQIMSFLARNNLARNNLAKKYLIRCLWTFICCLVGYGVLVICVLMMVAHTFGHSGVSEALLVRAMTYGFGGLLSSLLAFIAPPFKRYSCVNISWLWVVCTWLFMLPIMGFLWGVIIAAIIFRIYAKLENKEKQNPELQHLRNTIKKQKINI